MKNVVDKRKIDRLIRIRKKYWKTGDTDFLAASHLVGEEIESESGVNNLNLTDVIDAVVGVYPIGTLRGRREDVYAVL